VNGKWGESQICQGGFPAGESYSIRDIELFTDEVTGAEYVFASVGVPRYLQRTIQSIKPGEN